MRTARRLISVTASFLVALAACSTAAPSGDPGASAAPLPSSAGLPTATPTTAPTRTESANPAATPTWTAAILPSPAAASVLWESHGPVTDKTSTAYAAVDPTDGTVWIGIPFENRFWVFSPKGKYLESWGTGGTGQGEFDFSDHAQDANGFAPIAFAPDGSFYVGDTGNNRVEAFDSHRRFVREWGTFGTDDGQFVQIDSIATDGTTVYVGDGEQYNIQAFDTDGTFLRAFGADGGFSCVAVDAAGRVHATNPENPDGAAQAMAIFEPDGTEASRTIIDVPSTWAVQPAVDAAGNTFVPLTLDDYPYMDHGVVRIDPAGRVTGMWGQGGGDFIAVTPDGDAVYTTKGINLDDSQWTFVRKYGLADS
jgi:hypothetical protein